MSHVSKWGAVWVLVVLWLGSAVAQYFSMVQEPGVFHWSMYWAATFENWQSEFLQLTVQALLIASLLGQPRLFRADYSADKEDVDKILVAIGEFKREMRGD